VFGGKGQKPIFAAYFIGILTVGYCPGFRSSGICHCRFVWVGPYVANDRSTSVFKS